MATLMEKLPLPDKREQIVEDCGRLLDSEVRKKGGFGGLAVKAAYKVFKSFKPGAVSEAIDWLLDDFIVALEPVHDKYESMQEKKSFGAYMKRRPGEVAEALVGVTDGKANRSRHKTLVRAYRKLRPMAVKNVTEAVPGLADLFDRHYKY